MWLNFVRVCSIKLFYSHSSFKTFRLLSSVKMSSKFSIDSISNRLSNTVLPKHYNLNLAPDLTGGTFRGNISIDVNVENIRNFITLHSYLLVIHDVKLYQTLDKEQNEIPVSNFYLDEQFECLVIQLKNEIDKGCYKIIIAFSGELTRNIVGFYSSKTGNNVMAASKFQPTYARQAFPCFDEPAMKATFNISLVKPTSYNALSNMNVMSIETMQNTNTETVHFSPSVPMSTYLACFVICDYNFEEVTIDTNSIGEPFPLRAYARNTEKIVFALDIGKRATEFYIQYYQVPFPLPKLDMIAIPDYVSGATEHWGLITYRETAFLIDDATSSSANKISVANTIAHELAHMWFGNLVTMKWWDEVWLNEGFATYMQVKALNAIEPSWTMLDQFLAKTLQPVLVTDSKLSSHPIVQNVTTPDQITAIFDAISYNKGSSVLRMLEGFIGEENFQQGITDYLNDHTFGSTDTQDLLNALEPYFLQRNPNLNLRYILDTWIQQSGFPLVTVDHGANPYTFILTQSRFLADPSALNQTEDEAPLNYRWYIPITYKTLQGEHNETIWFSDTAESVEITLPADSFWLKVNNDQVGYYRVNYPNDVWLNLLDQLQMQSDKLTISDRAQLINDIFALASSRIVSYELALQFSTYLKYETQYVPWSVAAKALSDIKRKLQNTAAYDNILEFIQSLVSPLYDTMSWELQSTNTVIQNLLRHQILSIACEAGLEDARNRARQMLLNWLDSHDTQVAPVEPDLRTIVYSYGMRAATMQEWERLWQIYLAETDAQERSKLMHALASPEDVSILTRYLDLSWDESNVRSQDYLNVLSHIASNPAGEALVWDHVRSQWTSLVDRFTLNSRYLGGLIPSITAHFNTEERLQEMENFFAQHPNAGAGEAARKRALETVGNNIKWAQYNQDIVTQWLVQHMASVIRRQ